ncbi:hypothetical protein RYX36_023345, partial [Vicia faba]
CKMESNNNYQVGNAKRRIVGQRNKRQHATEMKDFISFLPLELMLCVFSFLTLEELILASLVSKEWTHLVKIYLSVVPSNLNLDELKMSTGIINSHRTILPHELVNISLMTRVSISNSIISGNKKFKQFVSRALYLYSRCKVKKLFLNLCYNGYHSSRQMVDQWIQFVMTNEVTELEINFSNGILIGYDVTSKPYEFPYIQPTSKSLVSLKLNLCNFLKSNLQAFCYLQCLFLKFVKILDFSIEDLATKCTMLKDLTIACCLIPLNFMVCKKDINFRSITVIRCFSRRGPLFPIDISSPKLLMFNLENCHLNTETNIKAPNLIEMGIRINKLYTNSGHRETLIKLLGHFSQCQTLLLNTWCIQVLSYEVNFIQSLPFSFKNLKHLKLQSGLEKEELIGISYLMRKCSYMERLTLHFHEARQILWDDLEEQNHILFDFEDDQYWQTQTSTFYCLEYCLKEVCVYSDFGRNSEMHMLQFLLENAKVLEKMFLYTHQKIRGQEVKQQLSNSQKASPIAKLFIFDL